MPKSPKTIKKSTSSSSPSSSATPINITRRDNNNSQLKNHANSTNNNNFQPKKLNINNQTQTDDDLKLKKQTRNNNKNARRNSNSPKRPKSPRSLSPIRKRIPSSPKLSIPEVLNSLDHPTDSENSEKSSSTSSRLSSTESSSSNNSGGICSQINNGCVPPSVQICPGFSEIPPNLLIFENDDIFSDDTLNTSGKRKRSTDEEEDWDPGKQHTKSPRKRTKSTSKTSKSDKNNKTKANSSSSTKTTAPSSTRTSKRVRNKPSPQNLTPMGLPKKRLPPTKKQKFSVEEIYKNENFQQPDVTSLETIFEEKDKESPRTIKMAKNADPKKMGRKLHRAIYFQTEPWLRVQTKTKRKKQIKKLQLYRITDEYQKNRRKTMTTTTMEKNNDDDKICLVKSKTRKQRRRSTDSKDKLNDALNDLREWEEERESNSK